MKKKFDIYLNINQYFVMINNKNDYLKLHLSVFLSGFTGLCAKFISLNETVIVFYRMLVSFLIFAFIMAIFHKKPAENLRETLKISLLGILLVIHLIFFFASIKYSNVSVGVVCYALVGCFTVFLEPLILKTKFSFKEFFYSLVAVGGICLIFNIDASFRLGIFLGIISAFLFALYTVFNKIVENGKSTNLILFYELMSGTIFMTVFLPIFLYFNPVSIFPTGVEWLWIIFLSLVCTIVLYLLYISSLKNLSAFTVTLAGNLEPLYGIAFAGIFFHELQQMNFCFYIGMTFILLSVFLQSFTKKTP